jgi:hypothetical protein
VRISRKLSRDQDLDPVLWIRADFVRIQISILVLMSFWIRIRLRISLKRMRIQDFYLCSDPDSGVENWLFNNFQVKQNKNLEVISFFRIFSHLYLFVVSLIHSRTFLRFFLQKGMKNMFLKFHDSFLLRFLLLFLINC